MNWNNSVYSQRYNCSKYAENLYVCTANGKQTNYKTPGD